MHHSPVQLDVELFELFEDLVRENVSFNYNCCDFAALDIALSEINWDNLFKVEGCFNIFKTYLSDQCSEYVPAFKPRTYKVPWFSKDLKRLKNLRNKFFKKFKSTKKQCYFSKYRFYRKEFCKLNKLRYKNYIRDFESDIKAIPKHFWSYIKSRKTCSNVPKTVF